MYVIHLSLHLSIQTHISVPVGRNFLLFGMMMAYGLDMMPIIFFKYGLSSQMYRQKCQFLKWAPMVKDTLQAAQHQTHLGSFAHIAHYIGFVLAANSSWTSLSVDQCL